MSRTNDALQTETNPKMESQTAPKLLKLQKQYTNKLLSLMPSKKKKNITKSAVDSPWTGFGAGRGERGLTLGHIC